MPFSLLYSASVYADLGQIADEAAALKAFNDEKNKDFRDRDLYVYCFSLPDGNIISL